MRIGKRKERKMYVWGRKISYYREGSSHYASVKRAGDSAPVELLLLQARSSSVADK